jgi:uncharacterized protein (UPF0335 family)
MKVSKEQLDALYTNLESLEKDKKEISDEISANIAAFASSNDLDKKAVAKSFKEWKEVNKDRDAYIELDLESDNLFQIAFPDLV